jgi:hypothetical protein
MKKIIIVLISIMFLVGSAYAVDLCISIPADKVTRVQDGVCGQYRYDPNTDGTQNAFVKKKVRQFIKESVLAYEYTQSKASIALESLVIDPNS